MVAYLYLSTEQEVHIRIVIKNARFFYNPLVIICIPGTNTCTVHQLSFKSDNCCHQRDQRMVAPANC